MLPNLQIDNSSNSIRWCHSAHPGYQGLQILPLQKLDPLGDGGLLIVVPVQTQKVDRRRHGL
jgi:hypothetical protein